MAIVLVLDVTKFIIPNWLNFFILLLYPVFLVLTPQEVEWWWSILLMLGFFAFGFLLFNFRIIGGGDVKLLVALSLWIGWQPDSLIFFVFAVSILGGVLSILVILLRVAAITYGARVNNKITLPRILTWGEPLPYGVAIAVSFVYMIWTNQILGLVVPDLRG